MNNDEKILSLLETLMESQTKLEQEITNIKHTLAEIEDEHGQKLDILFRGHDMLYKISTEIRSNVSALKSAQDYQDFRAKLDKIRNM